jgi:hypothetical protein
MLLHAIVFDPLGQFLYIRIPFLERASFLRKTLAPEPVPHTRIEGSCRWLADEIWHQHVNKSGVLRSPDLKELCCGQCTMRLPLLTLGETFVLLVGFADLVAGSAVRRDCTCREDSTSQRRESCYELIV